MYRFKNIGIKVSPEELSKLHKFSESKNMTISSLVRKAVNEMAVKERKTLVF